MRHSTRYLGLTLVELLMALTVTALIGAAIASMLSAVTYGTSNTHDLRSLVAKNKTLSARITAAVRQSRQVLDAGNDYLVLWTEDLNGSDAPDLLELQRIERDSVNNTLTSYTPDPNATDVAYDLENDDFDTITTNLISSGDLVGERWGNDVAGFAVTPDQPDPLDATLISYQLTLTAGGMSDVSVNAVSLRD
ncbi:MAG: hypothetical protein Kow00105_00550 [Phycisphaeraceae bacterium]